MPRLSYVIMARIAHFAAKGMNNTNLQTAFERNAKSFCWSFSGREIAVRGLLRDSVSDPDPKAPEMENLGVDTGCCPMRILRQVLDV